MRSDAMKTSELSIRSFVLLLLWTLLLPAASMAEDLTVHYKITDGKGRNPIESVQIVTADKVRTSDGHTDTIFDITTGKMILIDHKKEEYYETSVEEMQRKFAEIDEMVESNPMVKRMMMGKSGEVTVEEGEDSKDIVGYYCQHYIVTMGKSMRFDIWATTDLEAPTPYWDARKLNYASMGPVGKRLTRMIEAMEQVEGFPLATITKASVMGFKSNSNSEAVEVILGPADPSAFEIPEGYRVGKSPFAE